MLRHSSPTKETAVITVKRTTQDDIDLEVPLDIPAEQLCEVIVTNVSDCLTSPNEMGQRQRYQLQVINGDFTIGPDETLADAGIVHGDIVQVVASRVIRARLISDNGTVFNINQEQTTIGRCNPVKKIFVDIDLTRLDVKNRSSRPHARLTAEADDFYIEDLLSTNRTYVNDEQLPPGGRQPVQNMDRIQFGRGGVILTFEAD